MSQAEEIIDNWKKDYQEKRDYRKSRYYMVD
jgi:hypothetical protein